MIKNAHTLPIAVPAALLLMLILAPLGAAAQEYQKYTITNGRVYWSDAAENECDNKDYELYYSEGCRRIPVSINNDHGNYVDYYIYTSGVQGQINNITARGDKFLILDFSDTASAPGNIPVLGERDTTLGFDPATCAWSRTGNTGYYYQEWHNKRTGRDMRSYLVGSPSAGESSGLRLYTIEVGESNALTAFWYDWDFGLAISEVKYRDGVPKETYHWLYYDTVGIATGEPNKGWRMTPNTFSCYERPETRLYDNGNAATQTFYYADEFHRAYGNAGLFLPVKQIVHAADLEDATGLTTLTTSRTTTTSDRMVYGESLTATVGTGSLSRNVVPAYTEYREETYRRGINTYWGARTNDGFGYAGVPTIKTHYYDAEGSKINTPPTGEAMTLSLVDITYSLSPSSRRYLRMQIDNATDPFIKDSTVAAARLGDPLTIECYSVPPYHAEATLAVVTKFSYTYDAVVYYVYDTVFHTIYLNNDLDHRTDIDPKHSPVIMGYLCGGGRMASVGWDYGGEMANDIVGGNTTINVHNTDSIYALYGGNDISGWVQGSATINIGSHHTIDSLRIGYLYGGGCGYYTYENAYNALNTTWGGAGTYAVGQVDYGQYCFGGKVYKWLFDPAGKTAEQIAANTVVGDNFSYTPYAGLDFNHGEKGQGGTGTVPYIKSAHINIGISLAGDRNSDGVFNSADVPLIPDEDIAHTSHHNNHIHIDTIFGGGENSFIGIDGVGTVETAITLDFWGGTIMSAFGGNNYGGSVAQGAHVYVNVYGTKTTVEEAIENSYFTGYGRDFGIRHLFGGGNKVEGAHAELNIMGGMIDTLFLGGNEASVVQPIGNVDCRGRNFIYTNPYLDVLRAPTVGHPNPNYINLQQTSIPKADWDKFLTLNPGSYNSEVGRYNIRVMFGGNNRADMNNMSYVNLHSGGICYVYGGGNMGDMNNATPMIKYKRWRTDVNGDPLRYEVATGTHAVGDTIFTLDIYDSVRTTYEHWPYPIPRVLGSLINTNANARIIAENVYGGCRRANVLYSSGVSLSGGVYGYVQGGCDISGDVGSTISSSAEGSFVVIDSNAIVMQDVYGGSDGFYHCHVTDVNNADKYGLYQTEDVVDYNGEPYDFFHEYVGLPSPTQNHSNLYINGGHILFSAYGGGVMCDIGFKNGAPAKIYKNGVTQQLKYTEGPKTGQIVDVQSGSIHFMMRDGVIGSAYYHRNAELLDGLGAYASGPGNYVGDDSIAVLAAADELANNDGNAYGGGYLSSLYGLSYVNVTGNAKIYGSLYTSNDCMGSVNSFGKYHNTGYDVAPANVIAAADFTASDGTDLNNPAAGANAYYSAYVKITGTPRIACIYGGGNGEYVYTGPEKSLEVVCEEYATDPRPKQPSSFIDINTDLTSFIDTVFGGGNGVGVSTTVNVLLNVKGAITGSPDPLYVGTIFGGNNRDDMTCVPTISLKRGVVTDVYGGGNSGSMRADNKDITDICGNVVEGVSTYVLVNSDDAIIKGSLFGGCRMADVDHMAYIDVRKTAPGGIQYIYGGNDICGSVNGNTRIDVSGGTVHNIYGGSNGHYQYHVHEALSDVDVYTFDADTTSNFSAPGNAAKLLATGTTGEPYVDSTTINLWGGTITHDVYGGGRMGDCRSTTVVIDNKACAGVDGKELILERTVYGGGEGDYENLDAPRRGNTGENTTGTVTGAKRFGSTNVHLRHATNLASAKAYGGGRGGNARNTNITVYNTWNQQLGALYGGCWGSDVSGTATVTVDGAHFSGQNVVNLFGGNDFTGNVYRSVVNVNSGEYQYIYGGGNGDYPSSDYTSSDYHASATPLTLPNTEYVQLNFRGDTVTGNIYGGGKLGTVFKYQVDGEGQYVINNETKRKIADTNLTVGTAHADPNKYSNIIVNLDGGTIFGSVYAGGAGDVNQIVYGLKMLNMRGGTVVGSVYGGSQNVSDGYNHGTSLAHGECYSNHKGGGLLDSTTLRPSSIINISGGNVQMPVYGGGYLGNVFGSIYVNIGADAIATSPVWTNTYKNVPEAYAAFKPGASSGLVPAMTPARLSLDYSVYGGANWGSGSGEARFDKQGFYGGENMILIDGNGYNTGQSGSGNPVMDISKSIIGSGTSTEGGDVWSRIEIRNYGALLGCDATREITTVQRANSLMLQNTCIRYAGANDAISARQSAPYSINRIDTVNFRGYNVANLMHQVSNIIYLNFWEDALNPYHAIDNPTGSSIRAGGYHGLVATESDDLYDIASTSACAADRNLCAKLTPISNTAGHQYTAVIVQNGVFIDVAYPDKSAQYIAATGGLYGPVNGYAYLLAVENTNAVVTARYKVPNGTYASNTDDGGFMSDCQAENWQGVGNGNAENNYSIGWNTQCTGGSDCHDGQIQYLNYSNSYRVWSMGDGRRTRYAVILAHSNPSSDKMEADVNKYVYLTRTINSTPTNFKFAIAKATLTLPPTEPGHWYELDGSVVLSDENSELVLTDVSWDPTADGGTWGDVNDDRWQTAEDTGDWRVLPLQDGAPANSRVDVDAIAASPNNTFGIVMTSGNNFKTEAPLCPDLGSGVHNDGKTLLSGNANVSINTDYTSRFVGANAQTQPEMDLYMLYDTSFSNTMLGTVNFSLKEYHFNGSGVREEVPGIAPVDVVVTISTIIENFRDMEYEVMAMYNEGRTNTFVRKVILPATLTASDIYIKDITWVPTKEDGTGDLQATNEATAHNRFNLTDDTNLIKTHASSNLFSLSLWPTDNVSSEIEANIGWPTIAVSEPVNIYKTAKDKESSLGNSPYYTDKSGGAYNNPTAIDVHESMALPGYVDHRGLHLGKLDGRGLAALSLILNFDGEKIYPDVADKGYVGKSIITLVSEAGSDTTEFHLIVYFKTRKVGDTIYVASTDHFTRCGVNYTPETDPSAIGAGKRPSRYVQDLYTAIKRIYKEGDVIAIMDTVIIDGTSRKTDITMKGSDYIPIPIIRYFGHHSDLPGECGVYRGTMIKLKGQYATLSAQQIRLDGSSMGRLWLNGENPSNYQQIWDPYANDGAGATDANRYADTNVAFGPIIQVTDGATLNLRNSTTFENNYNGYDGSNNAKGVMGGAISLTDGGNLTMLNSITMANNITAKLTGATDIKPLNGTIYIDEGNFTILPSAKSTAITIINNYLVEQTQTADPATTTSNVSFFENYTSDGKIIRYSFKEPASPKRANVYLTRTFDTDGGSPAGVNDGILDDDKKTDVITVNEDLALGTRIGLSKWFPGEVGSILRDTIQAVYSPSSKLQKVLENGNFVSDQGFNIRFSEDVETNILYLHRCATFQHQLVGDANTLLDGTTPDSVFTFRPNPITTCPTGGDTMIYRVRGGFFPYTYSWDDGRGTITSHSTGTTNIEMATAIAASNYVPYRNSIADTFITSNINMDHRGRTDWLRYTISATDAFECKLQKKAVIKIYKTLNADSLEMKIVKWNESRWADTNNIVSATYPIDANNTSASRQDSATHVITGTRNYPAIQVHPRVWTDRTLGTIAAFVTGDENDYVYKQVGDEVHEMDNLYFCGGDVIVLNTAPVGHSKFLMWDFDPYYATPVNYVVPAHSTYVTAYYGPDSYWIDVIDDTAKGGVAYDDNYTYSARPTVPSYTLEDGSDENTTAAGYAVTYNDDVHIYNENGLAWFISVVNGLNGTQIRPFYFNRVFLHKKASGDPYDMRLHLWTPVGTAQHRFRGRFIGVDGNDANHDTQAKKDTCTVPATTPVVIRNIIVNEPEMAYTGFFAFLDSAQIKSIKLEAELVHGSQYVGGMAASAVNNTLIDNCIVADKGEEPDIEGIPRDDANTTILTTHYTSGGMVGIADHTTIRNSTMQAKYMGDAVYSGGGVGYGTSTTIQNTTSRNDCRMKGLYIGGLAGYMDGYAPDPTPTLFRTKRAGDPSIVANNYVHLTTRKGAQRVGGIVGYAQNTVIENNYVYGEAAGDLTHGAVGAVLNQNATASNNYYAKGSASRVVGSLRSGATVSNTASFSGSGNQVLLDEEVDGAGNLTQVLNIWVRANSGEIQYNTWRSDFDGVNNGYPVFGQPDLIPVRGDSATLDGCESVEWQGRVYTADAVVTSRVVDSTAMTETTFPTIIRIHHGTATEFSDSAYADQGYSGYGFYVSPTESALLLSTIDSLGSATLQLTDTLQTQYGCDSVVTLTLTFTDTVDHGGGNIAVPQPQVPVVEIYPNPTTDIVNVVAEGMTHVELYDNDGRRLQDYTAASDGTLAINLYGRAAGVYYLRVHTTHSVTIQKIVKI